MGYLTASVPYSVLSNHLRILMWAIWPLVYLVIFYLAIFISCTLLSNRLNASLYVIRPTYVFCAILPTVYLVPCHPLIIMSCLAILPSACLVLCYPTAIYGLSCLPGITHLVKFCFPQRLKSSDLRRCSSHLTVLALPILLQLFCRAWPAIQFLAVPDRPYTVVINWDAYFCENRKNNCPWSEFQLSVVTREGVIVVF